MAPVDRTVRRLHLQAVSDEDARRAALRLEDALRCAGLPDAGRRLLFVRRLSLGPMRADASAQAWALRLEQAMSQSALRWLPGDAPQAAMADAVWFRDTLHAHLALGVRLVRGPAPAEWFWPRLLPALAQAADAPTALAAVMQALAALPEGPVALPAWIAAMAREGLTSPVLTAAARADTVLLWRALGGRPAPAGTTPPAGSPGAWAVQAEPAPPSPEVQARALVARALRLAGEQRAARQVEAPALAVQAAGGRGTARGERPANDASLAARGTADPATATGDDALERAAGDGTGPSQPPRGHPALPVVRRSRAVPAEALLMGEPWPWADGRLTVAGGALFLVPLLERLGYGQWLASLPVTAARCCAAALWAALFTRLDLPPDDPAWALADAAVGTEPLPVPHPHDLAAAEARLCPARTERPAPWYGTTAHPGGQPAAEFWLALARRWLRRRAGLGLHALVLRPGWLQLSATHADLVFDLDMTDLRVRRAGLDLDPGWVPWLRRVVGFHFERLPWLAQAWVALHPASPL